MEEKLPASSNGALDPLGALLDAMEADRIT
jgi:hypothetical protein